MLNEIELGSILNQKLNSLTVTDIHWKTQDSDEHSILFYRLGENTSDEATLHQRLQNSKFSLLVINRKVESLECEHIVIPENEWPKVQNEILNRLYPLPPLKLIAVTGTNGKTTTTDLILQLGSQLGFKGLSIGTLGVRENGNTLLDFGMTSPPLIDLRKYLFKYGKSRDFCVMEASSHALVQLRLYGLKFDGGGWLSFSQDHLDYHQSMDNYFAAKILLFKELKPTSKLFVPASQKDLLEKLKNISHHVVPAEVITDELPLFFKPNFNRDNLEVAAAIVKDVLAPQANFNYQPLHSPAGRFYIKPIGTNFVVVDFAHTPDALENICQGIREAFPKHKLKVLFGCGGDRDRTKRPQMGRVVEKWASEIYLTSDNPRSEEPSAIIQDILQGIQTIKPQLEVERPKAVKKALAELREQEILLLAGKGHEDYILIKGVKYPYSDIQEVEEFVLRNKA